MNIQYAHCIEHLECKFVVRFSRHDNEVVRVESRDAHNNVVYTQFQKQANLEKYSKYKPAVALRAMEHDNVPVSERPSVKAFQNYRTDQRPETQKEPQGKTIFTFEKFLQDPPRGVEIDLETKVVSEDVVLVAFCFPKVIEHGARFWNEEIEVNLVTDATYKTNNKTSHYWQQA